MISSIGNSRTAFAAQSLARRTGATAFGNVIADVASTPVGRSVPTAQPTPQASLQGAGATDGKAMDFTHMTRSELRNVINSKIKSGELAIDGTEGFVVMMGPSDPEQAGQADNTQIDFMKSVRDQMDFSRQHGDTAWLSRLSTTLETMQRYQGRGSGVSLLA